MTEHLTETEMVATERELAESRSPERRLVEALVAKACTGDRESIRALVERELETYFHDGDPARVLRGWSQLYTAVRPLLELECARNRTHLSVVISRQVQDAAGVAWQQHRDRYWAHVRAANLSSRAAYAAAQRHVSQVPGMVLVQVRRRGMGRAS